MSGYDGPIRREDRDVTIIADGDVGFAHSLSHVQGELKTGAPVDPKLVYPKP